VQGDIFASDFSTATVVTMYLLPALNMKLRPHDPAMRPGTRVVSHSFTMEDWEADEISSMDGRRAYFWIVPANVTGGWTVESGGEKSRATSRADASRRSRARSARPIQGGLRDARLRGFNISFA
jgi:hypothetical protein